MMQRLSRLNYLVLLVSLGIAGCNASSEQAVEVPTAVILPPKSAVEGAGQPVPDNRTVNEFRVALLGNSHVHVNNLAGQLQQLLQVGRPQAAVHTYVAGGAGFLDERLTDSETESLLVTQSWSHVIVQGQKYSTSGLVTHPTDAAKYWLALIKSRQATPILFPEHARYGNNEEGNRVYMLHRSIAEEEATCVAPVPLAWYASLRQQPELRLHMADGNHANLEGTLLSAMIFFEAITGDPADQLPYVSAIPVSRANQQHLRQLASATLQQYPACPF
ncbi:hypothetical protein [Arsukibacterium sp.]|uniref:hypothetical protein n=1 Tax=Arsukibacterium sp. TaxID=1977258 RepID=UPI001BD51749|nr:hypothetical protein [Arsukibacterium sp.]